MARKNFPFSNVATAPVTPTAGTSLVVTAGHGTRFPSVPFKAVICPASARPLVTNAEIVNVTNVATDTLTIQRAQESSVARTVVVGDDIYAIESAANFDAPSFTDFSNANHDHGDTDDGGILVWQALPLGAVVQRVGTVFSAFASGTTTVPYDDTIPQSGEANEFMTQAITPKATSHILEIEANLYLSSTVAVDLTVALFQDAGANALAAMAEYQGAATGSVNVTLRHLMAAGTTSATTFKIRAGGAAAGTTRFNGGPGGGRGFGAITKSSIIITEHKA